MSYSELTAGVFDMHRFPLGVIKDKSGESQFKRGEPEEERWKRHKTHTRKTFM